jgi:hypothetical protein
MALIKCPECGKEISDKAASCPNCGYPINAATIHTENGDDEIFLDEYKDDKIEDTNSNTSSRLSKFKDIIIGSHIWIPLVCVVIIVFIILILVFSRNRQQKNIQYSNNNNVNTILQSSTHDISTTENTEETSTESIQEDVEVEDTQILEDSNNIKSEKKVTNIHDNVSNENKTANNHSNIEKTMIDNSYNDITNRIDSQTQKDDVSSEENNNVSSKEEVRKESTLTSVKSLPIENLTNGTSRKIYIKATLQSMTYTVNKYYNGNDSIDVLIMCVKTYQDSSSSDSLRINYRVYNSNGVVVCSSYAFLSSAPVGVQCSDSFTISNLVPDNYTIEFYDYVF